MGSVWSYFRHQCNYSLCAGLLISNPIYKHSGFAWRKHPNALHERPDECRNDARTSLNDLGSFIHSALLYPGLDTLQKEDFFKDLSSTS